MPVTLVMLAGIVLQLLHPPVFPTAKVPTGLLDGLSSTTSTRPLTPPEAPDATRASNWLDPAGIPGRPWFQHLLYSARYTYAHLEFPGLTEAVEGANWKLATEQVNLLDTAMVKNTELLRSAKSSWEKKE